MWDESMTKEKLSETRNAYFVSGFGIRCFLSKMDGQTSNKKNATRLSKVRLRNLQDVDEELLAVKWKFG